MSKLIAFSYVFFFIALAVQVNDYVFEYLIEAPAYFIHPLQWTLLIIVVCPPITGLVFGVYGKREAPRLIAIASNTNFFIAFAPLALLNLWITTFGIW